MDVLRTHDLRARLVDALLASGVIHSPAVADAMRSVPRHLFASWLSLEQAYADQAFPLPNRSSEGRSSLSQPSTVACMLQALAAAPGHAVLEIGTGTGYNTALLSHLVGPHGRVVSIDIEADLVYAARRKLTAIGASNVETLCRDGTLGTPEHAPFDRVLATVGVWEVPWAWADQLAVGGRLLAPVHLGGPADGFVLLDLELDGDHLAGVSVASLLMVPARGTAGTDDTPPASRSGARWQGAPADRLRVRIHRGCAPSSPGPGQKVIPKRASTVVLERRPG
ncbi:MAG: methyltransferase domain-containing protein [Deinococcales bacterium]